MSAAKEIDLSHISDMELHLAAERFEDGWKLIAAFFAERNWPDTKLSNAASALNDRASAIKDILYATPAARTELRQLREQNKAMAEALKSAAEALDRAATCFRDDSPGYAVMTEDADKARAALNAGAAK